MPLNLTAAHSSRIKKPSSGSRQKTPFASFRRTKAPASPAHQSDGKQDESEAQPIAGSGSGTARSSSGNGKGNWIFDESLPDLGPSRVLAESTTVSTVTQAVEYIQNTMFSAIPERRSGMNGARIAQVMAFRKSLPPIVSVAHVHVLLNEPTRVEKDIVQLIDSAVVRRLLVTGRGDGTYGLGDCLVSLDDWERLIRSSTSLDDALKDRFTQALRNDTKSPAVPAGFFSPEETAALVRSGFLVTASSHSKSGYINLGRSTASAASTDHTSNASGERGSTMILSLPNMGPYLRLLGAARTHILDTLRKSRYSEAPVYLIRDRWDGSIELNSRASIAKHARGEFSGVLPGRTNKWKQLYGLDFRWALEEALGAGLIEIFNTGSVGPGIRSKHLFFFFFFFFSSLLFSSLLFSSLLFSSLLFSSSLLFFTAVNNSYIHPDISFILTVKTLVSLFTSFIFSIYFILFSVFIAFKGLKMDKTAKELSKPTPEAAEQGPSQPLNAAEASQSSASAPQPQPQQPKQGQEPQPGQQPTKGQGLPPEQQPLNGQTETSEIGPALLPEQPQEPPGGNLPNYLHVRPVELGKIPENEKLPTVSGQVYPDIRLFIQHGLDEAFNVIQSRGPSYDGRDIYPNSLKSPGCKGTRCFFSRRAMQRLDITLPNGQPGGTPRHVSESWYARWSSHMDRNQAGYATFGELKRYWKDGHTTYLPNELGLVGWRDVTAEVCWIERSPSFLSSQRIFAVLVLTGAKAIMPDHLAQPKLPVSGASPASQPTQPSEGRSPDSVSEVSRNPPTVPIESVQTLNYVPHGWLDNLVVAHIPLKYTGIPGRPKEHWFKRTIYPAYASVGMVQQHLKTEQQMRDNTPPDYTWKFTLAVSPTAESKMPSSLHENLYVGVPSLINAEPGKFMKMLKSQRKQKVPARK
ncbi:uncharacterized protein GIQ15_04535 [Arthroderma uncinatum]|uniref:uncharacterized protein n=1 Tax=Arthroderma uncinatum TaxID=74035 RepID=UPI00144ABA50|nr:uncharacterized protein GIQ15_04535 [Arthroderma uncinatum]KAF3481776.1 hypothetical protein GIQ15_04535 [Arthroderma uncinatum]